METLSYCQLMERCLAAEARVEALEARCAALAAENAALIGFDADEFSYNGPYQPDDAVLEKLKTPATDAWVNEQRAVGANQVETNLRACYEESTESSRDIVDECIQIAASTAAQLRGSQV